VELCNSKEYPNIKIFNVDEVYEKIYRIYEKIPEDNGNI